MNPQLPVNPSANSLSSSPQAGLLSTTVIEPAARVCQNCQTPMHGPFCYQCGQHERSSLRHAGLLLRDILHDVFNLDSRAIRTLKPLLLKPGYLTLEYFAGRRQRYVPPLRLYVIASLVFFLIAGLLFSLGDGLQFDGDEQAAKEALDEPEVQQALQDPQAAAALGNAAPALREEIAKRRIAATEPGVAPANKLSDDATTVAEPVLPAADSATPKRVAADAANTDASKQDGDGEMGVQLPREMTFLPAFANQWLSELSDEVREKSKRIRNDPKRLAEAVMSVLPQSMFILLPLFALLLKLFYPFANRLYMEHLIVALHSHCFLFILFTLLIVGNHVLGESYGLTTRLPWLESLLGTVSGMLLGIGVPLYLYLMQKRVYGQSHWLTFSKFMLIGVMYLTLLSLVIAVDIVVGILQL